MARRLRIQEVAVEVVRVSQATKVVLSLENYVEWFLRCTTYRYLLNGSSWLVLGWLGVVYFALTERRFMLEHWKGIHRYIVLVILIQF